MSAPVEVQNLSVHYPTAHGSVVALDDVSVVVEPGSTLGLVGESGSGKTTLVNAMAGGLSARAARVSGTVGHAGTSILDLPADRLREYRRETLGYIGQDPHAALDPTMRVGRQLRYGLSPAHAARSADEDYRFHFGRVGLPDPVRVAGCYPHQLSGGMAQRVVIALALAGGPSLIIADEPTASLDSTLRTHILNLITRMAEAGGAALVMVSHDLTAVRRHCELTAVMYGGRIVERGRTASLFARPRHPYTSALLSAALGRETPGARLDGIPGTQQVRHGSARGCVFADRCAFRVDRCVDEKPAIRAVGGHEVACHRAEELSLEGGSGDE